MRNEIGSEFWDIPIGKKQNNIFRGATWFVSGRAALRAVLQQASVEHPQVDKKIAIPSFLCESMIQPILKEGFSYSFYQVVFENGSFTTNFSEVDDCEYVLVLNYFGYQSVKSIPSGKKVIIRDVTHSIFSEQYDDADYYFGSLRKWAGFLTGGFAYKKEGKIFEPVYDNDKYVNLRHEAMEKKKAYIEEKLVNKEYLQIFHKAEELLDECNIEISPLSDIEAAKMLDVDFIKARRRVNAEILISALKKYCLFKNLGIDDCPLCVPIMINNRDALRKYLISNGIYCPVHWPKPIDIPNGMSSELYEKELSLICDQRYDEKDMKRIANAVLSFMESESNV